MRCQSELRFKVLRKECVKSSNGENMKDTRSCPEHENIIPQQSLNCFRKVFKSRILSGCLTRLLGRRERPAGRKLLGKGEHRQRGQDEEAGNENQPQPPCSHPAGVVGGDLGLRAEIHVQPGAERTQDKAESGAEDPDSDSDGEVEGALPAGHVVVDVWDSEGVDRRLSHAHPEQANEEDGQNDGRNVGLLHLSALGRSLVRV